MIIKEILSFFNRLLYTNFCRISTKKLILRNTVIWCKKGNTCSIKESYLKKTKINIVGCKNTLTINSTLVGSTIDISGSGNMVEILSKDIISGLHLQVHGDNCHVLIDEGTAINGVQAICMGNGTKILIGKNCLFAKQIDIWATDSHPIFEITNQSIPINPSRDVVLKDHVWVGEKSCILKGVTIGKDSIIGMASVVAKDIPESSIVVGNPAKVIKQDITWRREHIKI